MTDARVRTLIVDDEELARLRLRTLLESHPDVAVVGEAEDGPAAIRMVEALRPDLLLLDIQVPGVDGLGVVAALEPDEMPAVVFVTAFEEFAVNAFEAHAVDYLLKPVTAERLAMALERARGRMGRGGARLDPAVIARLRAEQPGQEYRDRFAIRTGEHFAVVRVEEIAWVESADNYVRLHTPRGPFLLRARMADMEAALDPRRFLRIHRGSLVALDRVDRLEPWGMGEYLFVLADGTRLTSTRPYRDRIRAAFGL